MLKSIVKIAWRNLVKDRQFTILNLLGLSVGLTCAFLIGLWVAEEWKAEKYNAKDTQLYQVMVNHTRDKGIQTINYTPGILGRTMEKEIPEVEYAVGVLPASWFDSKGVVTSGDKKLKAGSQYVDRHYFDVFTCPFVAGDRDQLFRNKQSVAVSETFAKQLFGAIPAQDIIGKTVQLSAYEFSGSFLITGVFQPNPSNATEQFDLLFNYDLALEKRPGLNQWGNTDPDTYIIVKKGTDIAALDRKIRDFVKTKEKDSDVTLFLAKFSDRYLYNRYENGVQSGGRITYVRIFSLIAVFILLIACINFMNLSTAKAARRAKEVGIKKVVGASRSALVLQYLGESVMMALLSLLLAVLFVSLLLPSFSNITGRPLTLTVRAPMLAVVLGITILTGLLAGSYPALYLSGFRPIAILKGKVKTSWSEMWVRKGLVVFQFTLSVMFIVAVLVIYRQVQYIQNRDLGYNRANIIHFEIPLERDSAKVVAAGSFIKELGNIPGVVSSGAYSHDLVGNHGGISDFQWPGKNPNLTIDFANLEVGPNFLQTVGIRMSKGSYFSENANKAMQEIVFNETAIKAMGLKDPVGKMISFWGQPHKIVGVAADFNFESMYNVVKPCFFQCFPAASNVTVKLRTGSEKQTIAAVKAAYAHFNPGQAFEYQYLDENYQKLYASEIRTGILARCFAALAIFISCLGLFGLATFTAQKRQKEIGIRKVVGATVSQVTVLLSREFLVLVAVSILIAFPLVGWAMQNWLSDFAYRVPLGAGVFIITGIAAVALTILTVSWQSVRAALMNPVNSLRSE